MWPSQSPCDRNVLEELRSGQLGSAPPIPTEATPTKRETTPTPDAVGEEEDFDLDVEEDLNLDDLDLNADVSFTIPKMCACGVKFFKFENLSINPLHTRG